MHDVTASDRSSSPRPRLALFGASTMGRACLEELRAQRVPVECFLDNDAAKWGTYAAGVQIRQPSAEVFADLDVIWLTSLYANQIEQQLEGFGAAAKIVRTRRQVLARMRPEALVKPSGASPPPAMPLRTASVASTEMPPARSGEVAIVIADEGWILERCAREIEARLPYVRVTTAPVESAKLTYYVNYTARRSRVSPIEVAFFTHIEERAPVMVDRFFEAGRDVDVAVAMSERYARALRDNGVHDVRVITPGVDLDRFQPRVRIGVVGRTYHTGRKGEDLVRCVIDEPHIEWHFTGSGWPHPGKDLTAAELPEFYRSMDYILVPAHYEGGPMSVLEALACGVEVIAPNVGFVEDYPHLEFEAGNAEDLQRVLREVVETRLQRRRSVEHRSWDAWAEAHDRLFRELLPELSAAAELSAPVAAAPAIISATGRSCPRVLLALHAPETVVPSGGPSVRVPKMRDALRAHGIDADVATEELPDASGYDLVHVFNLWEPAAAKAQITHLRSFGPPVVLSPIALDLNETLWAGHTIDPLLCSGRSETEIERELSRLLATPPDERRVLGGASSEFWRAWPEQVRGLTGLVDHLIVLSDHELVVLDRMGALNTPYTLVHNGVDPAWATGAAPDAFATRFGLRDYALCVGTVESRKNQLLLARALRGTGIDLVLIGRTPQPAYADAVDEMGAGRVHYVGRLSHEDPLLASAYAGARLFVLPSWSEGAPLSALEAASFGLPMVLSDRSSEREYFGPLATYCDPGREDDIRARVLDAWAAGASDDRDARRARARAWIANGLTLEHAARQTAQAYARVLNARAPGRFDAPRARILDLSFHAAASPGRERCEMRRDITDASQTHGFTPLPYPNGVFDEVVAFDALGQVQSHELPSVLREWARIVRPGGRIDIMTRDSETMVRAGDEARHGGVECNEESLVRSLAEAGFCEAERHEPHSQLRLTARRQPAFLQHAVIECAGGPAAPVVVAPAEPPAILWDGPVFSVNGYAALARHVMRALAPAGVSISLTQRHDDGPGRIASRQWRDAWLWQRCLRRRGHSGVLVACTTAADPLGNSVFHPLRESYPGCQAYVGFSMFETDRLPDGWAKACEAMDEIWVPSQFVRDVFQLGGVPAEKLQVFPVGIDASRYDRDAVEPLPIPGRRAFAFLSVFDWSLRKGWDVLIEAYGRAFRASDDVCLVLRTAGRPNEKPADAIQAVFDRLGIPGPDRPTVIVLESPIAEDDMPRLYRAADAFALPTRGEGWGLPLMEAMASGLPTIATRWGGHLDFMDDEVSWLIDVDGLVPVDAEHARRHPFYGGGLRWAQPSVRHTATLLRKAFDEPEQARRLGRLGRESIHANCPPERMTRWVVERLELVASKAPPAPVAPKLVWDSPLFNFSGYAALTRHTVRALVTDGVSVQIATRDDDPKVREASLASREAWLWQQVLRPRGDAGVHISCYTPTDWQGDSVFEQRRAERPGCDAYVGLSMFETDRLPDGWVEACASLDEVWVPSRHSRDLFERAGVPGHKLHVLPVGIDADRYDPMRVEPLPIPGRRGFMFLSVFDWTPRKGWDVLIEAYARAFSASDDVCLVLRTANRLPQDRPIDAINARLDRLGIPLDERPAIIVLDAPVSEDDMPRLYRAADAFVLPTRGEGWGLPLMEAMASGLATIATGWGGHLDFMNAGNSWLIDVEGLIPVAAAQACASPFYEEDHRWAQPSIAHTARLMRLAFDDRTEARRLGRAAREDVRISWSPRRTAAWIADRVARLAVDPAAIQEKAAAKRAGRIDQAPDSYEKAGRHPDGGLARYNRASLLKRQGHRELAERMFMDISREADASLRHGAQFHLGEIAFLAGRFDDAHERFTACLAGNPRHGAARAWRAFTTGRLAERAGDLAAAERAYAEACTLAPDWPFATFGLASACRRLGQLDRARDLFAEVVEKANEPTLRGGSRFHLAQIAEAAGKFVEALAHLDACKRELPTHQGADTLRERLLARRSTIG